MDKALGGPRGAGGTYECDSLRRTILGLGLATAFTLADGGGLWRIGGILGVFADDVLNRAAREVNAIIEQAPARTGDHQAKAAGAKLPDESARVRRMLKQLSNKRRSRMPPQPFMILRYTTHKSESNCEA